MDKIDAMACFAALAQDTRLAAFRLLVRHEPHGLPAGEVSRRLDVPHNTMSAHLAVLARAGLVCSRRHGRSITYRASLDRVSDAVQFLVRDCCGARPELCRPLLESFDDPAERTDA